MVPTTGRLARQVTIDILLHAVWPPALIFITYVVLVILGVTRQLPGSDMVFHLVGGAALAWCVSRSMVICERLGARVVVGRPARRLFIVAVTATAAVLWEFAEFSVDTVCGTSFQVDNTDTMSDLALGIVGGVLVAVLWVQRERDV